VQLRRPAAGQLALGLGPGRAGARARRSTSRRTSARTAIEFLSNRTVLVTSETSHAVIEVNLISEKVVRVMDTGADTSHMLSATPDKTRVFTANIRSGSISAIDLEKGQLIRCVPTGAEPEAIDVSPDGREVWVGHNAANKLVVLDAHSLEVVAEMPTGELPIRLKCTVDGQWVLVSCARSGEVMLIDRAARKELARIPCRATRPPIPRRSASWSRARAATPTWRSTPRAAWR
jgi:DNA-binding beta-propeller fold protein YncE